MRRLPISDGQMPKRDEGLKKVDATRTYGVDREQSSVKCYKGSPYENITLQDKHLNKLLADTSKLLEKI
jgi:hypothetical protein